MTSTNPWRRSLINRSLIRDVLYHLYCTAYFDPIVLQIAEISSSLQYPEKELHQSIPQWRCYHNSLTELLILNLTVHRIASSSCILEYTFTDKEPLSTDPYWRYCTIHNVTKYFDDQIINDKSTITHLHYVNQFKPV